MSRIPQRVLRSVRLLSQEPVKVGIPPEPELPSEGVPPEGAGDEEDRPDSPSSPSDNGGASRAGTPAPPLDVGPSEEEQELLRQIEALQTSLGEAESKNAALSEAKGKLEAEIDGAKSDYLAKKKAIEADAASIASKAAEEARTRGHEEGWNAGHAEGLKEARAEIEKEYLDKFASLASALESIHQRLEENFSALVALNQPRMIRLWTEMLRRMLRRQVELNPDTIDVVLSDLLSRLSDKSQVAIYVSPEDIAHLEADMDKQFQEVLRGVHKLELKADSNVDRGSCIVETSLGVYDARWRTQMDQVGSVIDNIFQQIVKDDNEKAKEPEGPNQAEQANTVQERQGQQDQIAEQGAEGAEA